MPRIFFTGRKKIARKNVAIIFRPGRPPEFEATIDLSKHHRSLRKDARVWVEAYHNTMLQRFDFGTVADCRPRERLSLTHFDEWDRPAFRVLVVAEGRDSGVLLAACDRVNAIDPEMGAEGGRSMLKLYPMPNSSMRGELWRIEHIGGDYQLWYNKDVAVIATGVRSKHPEVLGLIIPAALREILTRERVWREAAGDTTPWTLFGQSVCGESPPSSGDGSETSIEEEQDWIDRVIAAFCRDKARFVERIAATEENRQ